METVGRIVLEIKEGTVEVSADLMPPGSNVDRTTLTPLVNSPEVHTIAVETLLDERQVAYWRELMESQFDLLDDNGLLAAINFIQQLMKTSFEIGFNQGKENPKIELKKR